MVNLYFKIKIIEEILGALFLGVILIFIIVTWWKDR